MVERRLAKAKVAGSNPVFRSILTGLIKGLFFALLVISLLLCYNVLVKSGASFKPCTYKHKPGALPHYHRP